MEASQTPNSQHLPSEGLHSLQLKRETACDTNQKQDIPKDHVAVMWKVQLLNAITPTQFGDNPADFPFFRHHRVRTGPGKPGKSWNFIMAFSRTGKSWKKATGPGKFWKFV